MASICVSYSQHILRLVYIKRFGLLVHNFRVNVPMKLNAPDDLLSK